MVDHTIEYISWFDCILYSGNILQEEISANHTILLPEDIFAIFDYCIHSNRRYVLVLIFANAFKI